MILSVCVKVGDDFSVPPVSSEVPSWPDTAVENEANEGEDFSLELVLAVVPKLFDM